MDFNINLKRLDRIDKLICRSQTGNPATFAKRMNISEATLYRYLRVMKQAGAPIDYDANKQTYFYERFGNIEIKFNEKDRAREFILIESDFPLSEN